MTVWPAATQDIQASRRCQTNCPDAPARPSAPPQTAGTSLGETPLMVAGEFARRTPQEKTHAHPARALTRRPPTATRPAAAQYGHEECVALLASAGHVEDVNEYGQRALHVACLFGRAAAARALLAAGAQTEACDSDGVRLPCGLRAQTFRIHTPARSSDALHVSPLPGHTACARGRARTRRGGAHAALERR